jgi:hypothetical protein
MVIFSTFLSLACASDSTENCNGCAKHRRFSNTTELIDLNWDGETKKRSLDHAAGAALPYLR